MLRQIEKAAKSPKTAAATSTSARPHCATRVGVSTGRDVPEGRREEPGERVVMHPGQVEDPADDRSEPASTTSGIVITHGDSCGSWPSVSSRKRSVPRNVRMNRRRHVVRGRDRGQDAERPRAPCCARRRWSARRPWTRSRRTAGCPRSRASR